MYMQLLKSCSENTIIVFSELRCRSGNILLLFINLNDFTAQSELMV